MGCDILQGEFGRQLGRTVLQQPDEAARQCSVPVAHRRERLLVMSGGDQQTALAQWAEVRGERTSVGRRLERTPGLRELDRLGRPR